MVPAKTPVVSTGATIKPSAENRQKLFQSSDFVSIRKMTQEANEQLHQKKQDEQEAKDEKPLREFTFPELQSAWDSFTETQLGDNMQVKTAFKMANLTMEDRLKLKVAFPSETQKMYFNDYRSNLAEYLKNEHQISGITYELDVLKLEEIKLSTRSDKEKFDAMREKNPSIEELRKRFNLLIDF
ncbi:MAG: hypothetical protein R2809_05815 [Flavobacteriales bacterium]